MRIKAGLKTKKSSAAPPPINPIDGNEGVEAEVKDPDSMGDSEWYANWKKEKAKQLKLTKP